MKRAVMICLSAVWVLSAGNLAYARGAQVCSGEKETLECLKENFTEVYENQYIKFLIIIGKAEKEALSCKSVESTAAYLDIASRIGDNPEVEDAFRDKIETKFLKDSPECFLEGLLLTDNTVKDIILGNYLQKPVYIKKTDVDEILSGYMQQEKYKEMLKRYSGK